MKCSSGLLWTLKLWFYFPCSKCWKVIVINKLQTRYCEISQEEIASNFIFHGKTYRYIFIWKWKNAFGSEGMAKTGSRKWWGHYREEWLNFLKDSSLFLSFFFFWFEFPLFLFFWIGKNFFMVFSHMKMLISYNYIYISFPLWVSLPLPVPPFPLQVVAELQAGLPVLYSSFPLPSYFTPDIVYMSMLPTFSICPTIS